MRPAAPTPRRVSVELGVRRYEIHIGHNILAECRRFLALGDLVHSIIVADLNVETYALAVAESLAADEATVDVVLVEPGEPSKSTETATDLWTKFADLGADRKTLVVAVGGGVVGDLAGFIAATYARGLRFAQVPTTLLAQVDSSVGGKVGINLPAAKNMVGAFWQPRGVVVDVSTLATLPDREYRSGLAEVVKYGVILDADFFAFLEDNAAALNERRQEQLVAVVERCCQLKAQVVERDEREETGHRAVLNYGHTFAHALETATGYGELLHGEAVAIGMTCAARLAANLGRVDEAFVVRQRQLLARFQLPVVVADVDGDALIRAMAHDKKVEHGRLRFILPTRLGHVESVADIDQHDVARAIEQTSER